MKKISLLDYLAKEMGVLYLSDLHYPEKIRKERFSYLLDRKIVLNDFSENEWIEAYSYISGIYCEDSEKACQCIKDYFSIVIDKKALP